AAAGTAAAAPLIERGLAPLAAIALGFHLLAVLCLAALPRLREPGPGNDVPVSAAAPPSGPGRR
ncbi:hypothetical protein, partial [Inquilinus limosus]|uniref:hypothetical protein n=1 Tax=Inquilinus limosus TaxID=171674 RepID=UPI001930BE60